MNKHSLLLMFSVFFLISCNQRMIQKDLEVKNTPEKESIEAPLAEKSETNNGFGIEGRKVRSIPNLSPLMVRGTEGLIAVKMCVNRNGDVIFTELIPSETTITNEVLLKKALRLASKYKYEKDLNGPVEQCGKFIFKLDSDKRKK